VFGFGNGLMIRAWVCHRRLALALGIRSGFGYKVRLRAGPFVWTFGKALRKQEYAIVLGSCSLRESREKSKSTVRSSRKSWKSRGMKVFVFLLLARES